MKHAILVFQTVYDVSPCGKYAYILRYNAPANDLKGFILEIVEHIVTFGTHPDNTLETISFIHPDGSHRIYNVKKDTLTYKGE